MKRSRIFVWFVRGVVCLVVLAIGLGFFLQTEAAFRWVIAPAIESLGFGTLRAQRGHLGWPGRVEIQEGSYTWPDVGLSVTARQLSVEIVPRSLFGDGPVRIRSASLDTGQIVISTVSDQSSSPAAPSAAKPSATQTAGGLPVILENAVIQATTIGLESSGSTTTIGPLDARAENWKPGEKGKVSLSGNFRVQPDQGDPTTGRATLEGRFEADRRALPKNWAIDGNVRVLFGANQERMSARMALEGERRPDGTLELDGHGTLSVKLPTSDGKAGEKITVDVSEKASVDPDGESSLSIGAKEAPQAGTIRLSLRRPAKAGEAIRLDLRVADFDFQPLLSPFIDSPSKAPSSGSASGADDAGVSQEGVPARDPVVSGSQASASSSGQGALPPLDATVLIERSRFRQLQIGRLDSKISSAGEAFALRIDAKEIAGGAATLDLKVSGATGTRLRGDLDVNGVKLGPLMKSFAVESSVDGKLSATGSFSSDAPSSLPVVDDLNGNLTLDIRDGRLKGFESLDLLAKATGIGALGDFAFSRLDGRFSAEHGLVRIDSLNGGGGAAYLAATGTVDLRGDGKFDLSLNPRVGPDLAARAKAFRPLARILSTAQGLLSLPVKVRITGPLDEPKTTIVPETLRETVGTHGGHLAGDMLDDATLGESKKLLSPLTDLFSDDR